MAWRKGCLPEQWTEQPRLFSPLPVLAKEGARKILLIQARFLEFNRVFVDFRGSWTGRIKKVPKLLFPLLDRQVPPLGSVTRLFLSRLPLSLFLCDFASEQLCSSSTLSWPNGTPRDAGVSACDSLSPQEARTPQGQQPYYPDCSVGFRCEL